jgi:hypothetical protein
MPNVDGEQKPLRLRLVIKWLLVFFTIAGILGTFTGPSDAFQILDVVQHERSTWVGGVAALITFALCMMLWASKACRTPNSKAPLISQAITGSLLVCTLNGFTFLGATSSIERWIARSTAKADTLYLTTVKNGYQRGCVNSVEWYEPTVKNNVIFCTNLAIFQRSDGRTPREAIAHVLRGPYGIRVVTIRALDTDLGQEDLAAMRSGALGAVNQPAASQ